MMLVPKRFGVKVKNENTLIARLFQNNSYEVGKMTKQSNKTTQKYGSNGSNNGWYRYGGETPY
jgi:hypothetical protein